LRLYLPSSLLFPSQFLPLTRSSLRLAGLLFLSRPLE
jgi:hypothetical protein